MKNRTRKSEDHFGDLGVWVGPAERPDSGELKIRVPVVPDAHYVAQYFSAGLSIPA
jgi:hypothetical protein